WQEAFYVNEITGWFATVGNGVHHFYSEYTIDISDTPRSILSIPFLSNIAPIAWVYDATIYIDEIDEDFLNSLDDVKEAFSLMYPSISFNGRIISRPVKNWIGQPKSPPLAL